MCRICGVHGTLNEIELNAFAFDESTTFSTMANALDYSIQQMFGGIVWSVESVQSSLLCITHTYIIWYENAAYIYKYWRVGKRRKRERKSMNLTISITCLWFSCAFLECYCCYSMLFVFSSVVLEFSLTYTDNRKVSTNNKSKMKLSTWIVEYWRKKTYIWYITTIGHEPGAWFTAVYTSLIGTYFIEIMNWIWAQTVCVQACVHAWIFMCICTTKFEWISTINCKMNTTIAHRNIRIIEFGGQFCVITLFTYTNVRLHITTILLFLGNKQQTQSI